MQSDLQLPGISSNKEGSFKTILRPPAELDFNPAGQASLQMLWYIWDTDKPELPFSFKDKFKLRWKRLRGAGGTSTGRNDYNNFFNPFNIQATQKENFLKSR